MKWYFILFCFTVNYNIYSQTFVNDGNVEERATLSGVVLAGDEYAEGISIITGKSKKGVITNSKGEFKLVGLAPGMLELHFSGIGIAHSVKSYNLQSGENFDTVRLVREPGTMQEVVVSGTMRAVSKLESPIPVEVYTPVLFKKNPSPSIFESLQMINGVQPQLNCNVCNTGDIHINGMEGPYTMILIDGMPIVSSLSTVYGLSGIPNSMIKRIEVVKGPASTLYGSEAVGGLINIITKDAGNADRLKTDLSATSIGEYNADISAKINAGKSAGLLGINYFNFWNRRDINGDNFTDVTLQNRLSLFNKWNIYRENKRQFSIAGRYVYENRWGGELQWTPAYRGSNKIYGESIYTNRYEVIGNYELSKNWWIDLSYNYHHQDSYYGTVKYDAKQHVSFGQLRYNRRFREHEVLFGLPLRYTWYDDNSPATAKSDGTNQPSATWLPGIFVQDEWALHQNFTTLIGVRYDYNNHHGSILSPRVSFKFSPLHNHTFRLSTGNGYRVVNLFTEDHAALSGARDVVITEALKPEKSWNVNANYAAVVKAGSIVAGIDASAFYTYFNNKIVGDFVTDPQKIIYQNLDGYAISKGITLNADISINNRFKTNAGITLMDVYSMEEGTGDDLTKVPQLFAPRFSGTYALSYSLPHKGLSIDWTGRINGTMHLPVVPNDFRPAKSPLYCLMNVQLTKTINDNIEVYGGVKNLLNFIPENALLHPDDPFDRAGGKYFDTGGNARSDTNPFGYTFDPSYNYAPIQGAKGFIGIRWALK